MGLAGLFVAMNTVPGAATPAVGFTSEPLGRGTYASHGSLALKSGLDIVTSRITLTQGGSSGWHSHPGGAIAIVQQGELTVYALAGKRDHEQDENQGDQEGDLHCVITRYIHGQSFIERIGDVVDAVNTGSTDTILLVTFPGVPVGGSSRIDQMDPGVCPGV
jgi:quercetin dioxygenase-like cupin family protein